MNLAVSLIKKNAWVSICNQKINELVKQVEHRPYSNNGNISKEEYKRLERLKDAIIERHKD